MRFAADKHPWKVIYDEETTRRIGAIIGVTDDNAVFRLRCALVQAAEMIANFADVFGGISAKSAKQQWMKQTNVKIAGLLKQLDDAEGHVPERLAGPDFRASIASLRANLASMQTALKDIPDDLNGDRSKTLHADFLQFTVDRLVEVFALFRPNTEIKRSVSGGVYGTFPDFIRAAAKPYLLANYKKFRLSIGRYEKLDRQIQNATARSKGDYERYGRGK